MSATIENMTIGVLAKSAGVSVETVRYYQRRQLLPEPNRIYGSIRRYDQDDLQRLVFIKNAQGLGFTLDEIAELLHLEKGSHCEETRVLAEQKLENVREKLTRLQRIEEALTTLIQTCHEPRSSDECPLYRSLQNKPKIID